GGSGHCCECFLQRILRRDLDGVKLQPQRPRRSLHFFQFELGLRIFGIEHDRHWRYVGDDFFEQLESFPTQVWRNNAESGGIPTRPRKTLYETSSDRIADDRHYDRYRSGRALECLRRRRTACEKDIDIAPHELGGKR